MNPSLSKKIYWLFILLLLVEFFSVVVTAYVSIDDPNLFGIKSLLVPSIVVMLVAIGFIFEKKRAGFWLLVVAYLPRFLVVTYTPNIYYSPELGLRTNLIWSIVFGLILIVLGFLNYRNYSQLKKSVVEIKNTPEPARTPRYKQHSLTSWVFMVAMLVEFISAVVSLGKEWNNPNLELGAVNLPFDFLSYLFILFGIILVYNRKLWGFVLIYGVGYITRYFVLAFTPQLFGASILGFDRNYNLVPHLIVGVVILFLAILTARDVNKLPKSLNKTSRL